MRKLKVSILLITMLVLSALTIIYGETKSEVKVIYNTHTLDFGDKSVVNQDGSLYIPIRALSEKLHYTVDWNSTTNTARIYDNLNDIYLSTNGEIKVNGIESKSDKVPMKSNGSIYVPLRFVSETLGVSVNYDSANRVVNMTGRTIYEISQQNIYKPVVVGYTKDGKKITYGLADKTNYIITGDTMDTSTKIKSVSRTKYSDVVTTTFMYQGGITSSKDNQLYIQGTNVIECTGLSVGNFEFNTEKFIGTAYLEDRVALLIEDKIVKIYDDKTGALIKEINGVELYKARFDEIFKSEKNGEIYNIQAVGTDFIVVNMYQPNIYSEPRYNMNGYYYTTVINLDTMEIVPVYQHLNVYKNNQMNIDFDAANMFVGNGTIVNDGVYFSNIISDGKLKFVAKYGNFNTGRSMEVCTVDYK